MSNKRMNEYIAPILVFSSDPQVSSLTLLESGVDNVLKLASILCTANYVAGQH
jgi:hypothetical protein